MLKTLHEELESAPPAAGCGASRPRRQRPPRRPRPALRATIRSTATFLSRARLNKPGSEKETWHVEFDLAGMRPRLRGRRFLRPVSAQRSGAGRRGDRGARRAGGFPDRRPHAARGADRRRVAVAGARHAVPAVLLHHRRRAAEEGAGAGGRRGPGRRRGDARRAGGDREIPRRPARPGSLHRGARSAAAAALFDLVVAEGQPGPRLAHRRCGALRHRQAPRGSASPRPSSPTASRPAHSVKVYVQKAHAFGLPADPTCRSS